MPTPEYLNNVDINQFGQNMATGIVQGWNFFDNQPFAALVWFLLLALIIIYGIMSIRHHLETMDNGH
jgi:hypothetical protein